jgi:hypothetical protein
MGFVDRAQSWSFSQRLLFCRHFVLMPPEETHKNGIRATLLYWAIDGMRRSIPDPGWH